MKRAIFALLKQSLFFGENEFLEGYIQLNATFINESKFSRKDISRTNARAKVNRGRAYKEQLKN